MKRIYANLNKTDYKGRVLLTAFETARDLAKHEIVFREGETFYFYNDDDGENPVVFEGITQYDSFENRWVAKVDSDSIEVLTERLGDS
jgi:hypothetical protein